MPVTAAPTLSEVRERLQAIFPASDLYCRIGTMRQDKSAGILLTYVDATAVMTRLDDVVGPDNWSEVTQIDVYDGNHIVAICHLTVLGITRTGVGEGGAESEPYKAAASDAFKRAAWMFGIGAYLRRMPRLWWPLRDQRYPVGDEEDLSLMMYRMSEELVNGGVNLGPYKDAAERAAKGQEFIRKPTSTPDVKPSVIDAQSAATVSGPPVCEVCGKPLAPYTSGTGRTYTAEQMAEYSRRDTGGHVYCRDHKPRKASPNA